MDPAVVAPRATDYAAWCAAHRLNPHHPEDWSDVAWETYVEELRAIIRPDLEPDPNAWPAWRDRRRWPPARRSPWTQCPCHPLLGTPRRDEIGYPHWPKPLLNGPEHVPEAEVSAWVAEDPAARAFVNPRTQKHLAFIERFRPKNSWTRTEGV